MSAKRIQRELNSILQNPIPGITVEMNEDKLTEWKVQIVQNEGFFKGGVFKLQVEFAAEFPFKAPIIKFFTRIYHPNVDSKGSICMSMLKNDQWKPQTQMRAVFEAIVNLLLEPNPDDPLGASTPSVLYNLDSDIADCYKNKRSQFEQTAAEWTKKYAKV